MSLFRVGCVALNKGWGGGEGNRHMKGVGMLVVSLRGVNFGFWSHLGCSGQNASHLALKVSFRVAREKYKNIYCI